MLNDRYVKAANGMKLNQQSELGHGGIVAPKREQQHTVVPR